MGTRLSYVTVIKRPSNPRNHSLRAPSWRKVVATYRPQPPEKRGIPHG